MKLTWRFLLGAFLITTFLVAPFLKNQESANRKTAQEKLEYIEQNRPYLEASLVVDSESSNSVSYHYEIQNTGKLPASSISEEQKSPFFTAPEFETKNRYLSPGAKMSAVCDRVFMTGNLSVELFLKYTAEYQNTNKSYNFLYKFFIPREILKIGEYHYMESLPELTESPVHGTNTKRGFFNEIFNNPEGSWTGFANETNGVSFSQFFAYGTNRFFLFEPACKTAILKSTSSSGKPIVLVKEFKEQKTSYHFVCVQWTTNGAFLMIDSNSVSESFP